MLFSLHTILPGISLSLSLSNYKRGNYKKNPQDLHLLQLYLVFYGAYTYKLMTLMKHFILYEKLKLTFDGKVDEHFCLYLDSCYATYVIFKIFSDVELRSNSRLKV